MRPPVTLEQLAAAEVQILRMYANSPNDQDKRSVARNPRTPADALIRLAGNEAVRSVVLENPNCPLLVKMYFTSDGYSGMTLEEFLEASGVNL